MPLSRARVGANHTVPGSALEPSLRNPVYRARAARKRPRAQPAVPFNRLARKRAPRVTADARTTNTTIFAMLPLISDLQRRPS